MRTGVAIVGVVLAALAGSGGAAERSLGPAACPEPAREPVVVAEVIDGTTLRLGDGRAVRLAGIEPPRVPLGSGGPSPLAEAARMELIRLAAGEAVMLLAFAPKPDRYGRLPGELVLADGRRVTVAIVAAGFARVRVVPGDVACFADLLAAERTARKAKAGLWVGPNHAIRRADDASLGKQSGLYELVEGLVVSVGHGTSLIFLDFGRDYRRDFTIMLSSAVAKKLTVPVDQLAKRRIRVRGIVEESNGPAIRVEDPAAIEVLDED